MNLPKHLFISESNGSLYDTRSPKWSDNPLRVHYKYTFRNIANTTQLKATIRNGGFTFPGLYPLFFITHDGEAICFNCAKKDFKHIASDMHGNGRGGWAIAACDVNYEDKELVCCNCNQAIESAY